MKKTPLIKNEQEKKTRMPAWGRASYPGSEEETWACLVPYGTWQSGNMVSKY